MELKKLDYETWDILWKAFHEHKFSPIDFLRITRPLLEYKIDSFLWETLWDLAYKGEDIVHFLDSISPNQLKSKKWLIDALEIVVEEHFENTPEINFQLFGGWFGFPLSKMLKDKIEKTNNVYNIDKDPNTEKVFNKFKTIYDIKGMHFCQDVMKPTPYDHKTHVVINTSSEHMPSLSKILEIRKFDKAKTIFALQSNNMFHVDDHINCVENENELLEKSGIKKIIYKGSLDMPNGYKRFMVIGKC